MDKETAKELYSYLITVFGMRSDKLITKHELERDRVAYLCDSLKEARLLVKLAIKLEIETCESSHPYSDTNSDVHELIESIESRTWGGKKYYVCLYDFSIVSEEYFETDDLDEILTDASSLHLEENLYSLL